MAMEEVWVELMGCIDERPGEGDSRAAVLKAVVHRL